MKPERREIADGLMGLGITAPVTHSENNPTGMRWRIGEDGSFRLEAWLPGVDENAQVIENVWTEVPLYVPGEVGK